MIVMQKQVQKLIMLTLIWISLPTFLLVTNPETLPLALLIVPFTILFLALYLTASMALVSFFKDITPPRRKLMAGIAGTFPVLLLLLASIKQLSIRDTAIVLGLLLLLMFYLRRLNFIKNI